MDEKVNVPVAWQLYRPKSWSKDRDRCDIVGVTEDIAFSAKSQIALALLRQCGERGFFQGIVLADVAFANGHGFCEGLESLSLFYIVVIKGKNGVWGPGVIPVKLRINAGKGHQSKRLKYTDGDRPESVKAIALNEKDSVWRYIGQGLDVDAVLAHYTSHCSEYHALPLLCWV